jgi:hypothetical protein
MPADHQNIAFINNKKHGQRTRAKSKGCEDVKSCLLSVYEYSPPGGSDYCNIQHHPAAATALP